MTDALIEKLFSLYKTNDKLGLSDQQVLANRSAYGKNTITTRRFPWLMLLLRQFTSGFTYLLCGASLLSIFLRQYSNAAVIFVIIIVMGLFGFYQEFYADKTVQKLRSHLQLHCNVRRNGLNIIIPAEELVCGDIIFFGIGDILGADIQLISDSIVRVDESILTGEFNPVEKQLGVREQNVILHAGTKIVASDGEGVVVAVGDATKFGQLLVAATNLSSQQSDFSRGLNKFSKLVLLLVSVVICVTFFIHLLTLGTTNLIELLIFYISIVIAVVPQALQVVVNFALARSATVLAKQRVLVKRFASLEDLASVEVMCVDKTGTLTENKLSVAEVWSYVSENKDKVLAAAYWGITSTEKKELSSFDNALLEEVDRLKMRDNFSAKVIKKIPFDLNKKINFTVISREGRQQVIVRGAFESVARFCSLNVDVNDQLQKWIAVQEFLGRRVLAVAQSFSEDFNMTGSYELTGAISFQDTIKKTAYTALEQARRMKIKVKMLTGDSPGVACQVAFELGLIADRTAPVIIGEDFEKLSQEKKELAVTECDVFARVSPLQKFEIIKLLERHYDVGFIGEGLNDIPSLKAAAVGFAVNNAADATKDAADIIIFSKNLQTIVATIQEGRTVFINTIKYLRFTLASNFSNFYTLALISLITASLPMLPVQLLVVNILSDLPMLFIATDRVEQSSLEHPLAFDIKKLLYKTMFFGAVCTVFDFCFFAIVYTKNVGVLQSKWFVFSILSEIILFLPMRSPLPFWQSSIPSRQLVVMAAGTALLAILFPLLPCVRDVLWLQPLVFSDYVFILLVLGLNVFALEGAKFIWRKYLIKNRDY